MDFSKCSFTILGAGRSGLSAAKLLKRHGAEVFLSDGDEKGRLKFLDESSLHKSGIVYELGGHTTRVFESDIIIKSPGIAPDSEVIGKAKSLGKKIYSEIEIAFRLCRCPVIAITGTNGKTTTTELTGAIFRNAGFDVRVCGNVGLAFSEVVDDLHEKSIVVLEVSSFQLNDIEKFKPRVAVLLNIAPDHIDWHGSFESYLGSKLNIFKNQDENDLTVINYDDDVLRDKVKGNFRKSFFSLKKNLKAMGLGEGSFVDKNILIYFSNEKNIYEEIMSTTEINIRGNHNLYNSLAAVISARAFEIRSEIIKESLQKFSGVEHRIEFVRTINGISFYNDSKSTNIDSLIVALESFEGNIILILGGRENGNDYSRVDELIKRKVKKIYAVGETKRKIYNYFKDKIKTIEADSYTEAVKMAFDTGIQGDVVLLSPACKSFDMFESYEHRGREFKRMVNEL